MSQQIRPIMSGGKLGVGSFGVAIMPDGTPDSLRTVIKPDGFHFEPYDFEGLSLPSVTLHSPTGSEYVITFDDKGSLLINGMRFVSDVLTLTSPNGTKYKVVVDDAGILTTVKEVKDDVNHR